MERPGPIAGHAHLRGSLTDTPSARLRRKLGLLVVPFAAYGALVETRDSGALARYLVLQHQIIRATVPLTEAALARTRELDGNDPLAGPLATYLEEHVGEVGPRRDAARRPRAPGLHRASVLARMPSPAVAGLVGSQYYWIHHYHPIAFLGYVALMEGYPPSAPADRRAGRAEAATPACLSQLPRTCGTPPGTATISTALIDSLPIDASHFSANCFSADRHHPLAASSLEELRASLSCPAPPMAGEE